MKTLQHVGPEFGEGVLKVLGLDAFGDDREPEGGLMEMADRRTVELRLWSASRATKLRSIFTSLTGRRSR